MKLMFNKKEFYGKWLYDDELNDEYTEKVPQHTNQYFDEEQNEWADKQIEIEESEIEII